MWLDGIAARTSFSACLQNSSAIGVQSQAVLAPLTVPAADAPLARCNTFESVWSSHQASADKSGPPYATAGAGGVDGMAADRGVTVWCPQPPNGYAITGHVLAAGMALACVGGYFCDTLPTSCILWYVCVMCAFPAAPPGTYRTGFAFFESQKGSCAQHVCPGPVF